MGSQGCGWSVRFPGRRVDAGENPWALQRGLRVTEPRSEWVGGTTLSPALTVLRPAPVPANLPVTPPAGPLEVPGSLAVRGGPTNSEGLL